MKNRSIIFFSCTFFLFSQLAFSELHRPNRYFEFSEEVEVGARNNYFQIQDFSDGLKKFKDNFDFEEMAQNIPNDGWNADADFMEKTEISFNFSNEFRISLFAGANGNGHLDASKNLFTYLAYDTDEIEPRLKSVPPLSLAAMIQNKDIDQLAVILGLPGSSDEVKVGGYVDVMATGGLSFYTTLSSIGINIRPTYYMPLIHVPKTVAKASYSITDDGLLKAEARVDLKVYTGFDYKYFDKDYRDPDDGSKYSNTDKRNHIFENLKNGGFAVDFEFERNFFDRLDLGLFGQIPVTPGRMKYLTTTSAYANYTVDLVKEAMGEDTKKSDYDTGDRTYSSDTTYKYYRPLRAGGELLFTPVEGFSLYTKGNVVLRNPYKAREREIYGEYDVDMIFFLKNLLKFSVGSAYENQVFIQKMGLDVNLRLLEVIAQASLRGDTFKSSFNGKGVGAYAGIKIGF